MCTNRIKPALCGLALTLACCGNSPGQAPHSRTSAANPPARLSAPAWVSYTDSAEGAFSIDVPVGWQVQGGMVRFGYADVRWMMDVRSLDGKVIIRINDANIPPYAVPGANTPAEGQPLILPQQMQLMVSSYREAQAYGETYAKHRFGNVCTHMAARPPDWKPTLPPDWQVEAEAKSSVAGLAYTCSTSDGPRLIAIYVRTALHAVGLWQAEPVISILATPADMALAHSMAQRMIDTWQSNPEWQSRQQQLTRTSPQQIQAEFARFMQQMHAYVQRRTLAMNQQLSQYQLRQGPRAQQISSWGESLTGLTHVADPLTGTQFQVVGEPAANNYSNGAGITLHSNLSPGANFHQVTQAR